MDGKVFHVGDVVTFEYDDLNVEALFLGEHLSYSTFRYVYVFRCICPGNNIFRLSSPPNINRFFHVEFSADNMPDVEFVENIHFLSMAEVLETLTAKDENIQFLGCVKHKIGKRFLSWQGETMSDIILFFRQDNRYFKLVVPTCRNPGSKAVGVLYLSNITEDDYYDYVDSDLTIFGNIDKKIQPQALTPQRFGEFFPMYSSYTLNEITGLAGIDLGDCILYDFVKYEERDLYGCGIKFKAGVW